MPTTVQPSVKLVVMGDGAVGKTCMLIGFKDDKKPNPEQYVPTVFDNYSMTIELDQKSVSLKRSCQ